MSFQTDPDSTSSHPKVDRRSFVKAAALAASGLMRPGVACAQSPPKPSSPVRVRVWCEGTAPRTIYPNDVDGALGDDFRRRKEMAVTLARLGTVQAGLSDAELDATDTLVWWGRLRHDDLPDDRAQ